MSAVVVVGGGMGGLVLARDLARAGREVTVVERGDRLGGQLDHHEVGGLLLDSGAESFATRGGSVARLATELGLGDDVVPPVDAAAWVHRADGSSLPLPRTSVLGIPGTPLAADVLALLGTRAALRAFADALLPGTVAARSRTLGELVRRRMGDAVVDELVAPVTRGVHSAHPDDLELDRVAPGVRAALLRSGSLARGVRELRLASPAGTAVQGIRGGLHRLRDALVADLESWHVDLRTGVEATAVEHDRVLTTDGELLGTVVVAAPGLVGPAPPTTTVTLVTLVLDAPELDGSPRGTGVLVAAGAPEVRARALTHLTAKWQWVAEAAGGRHAIRLSYDGDVRADASAAALDDANRLLGVRLRPDRVVELASTVWTRARATAAPEGIHSVGEWVSGTGLASVVSAAREQAESLIHGSGVP